MKPLFRAESPLWVHRVVLVVVLPSDVPMAYARAVLRTLRETTADMVHEIGHVWQKGFGA